MPLPDYALNRPPGRMYTRPDYDGTARVLRIEHEEHGMNPVLPRLVAAFITLFTADCTANGISTPGSGRFGINRFRCQALGTRTRRMPVPSPASRRYTQRHYEDAACVLHYERNAHGPSPALDRLVTTFAVMFVTGSVHAEAGAGDRFNPVRFHQAAAGERESIPVAESLHVDLYGRMRPVRANRWYARLTADPGLSPDTRQGLQRTLTALEGALCMHFACRGPDVPFGDMSTCRRCAAIQDLRTALTQPDDGEADGNGRDEDSHA